MPVFIKFLAVVGIESNHDCRIPGYHPTGFPWATALKKGSGIRTVGKQVYEDATTSFIQIFCVVV